MLVGAGMLRLQREEPDVVVGDVRGVHLPGLLGRAPQPGRAPHVRALHAARHQLDVEAAAEHAARRECQCGMMKLPHNFYYPVFMILVCAAKLQ